MVTVLVFVESVAYVCHKRSELGNPYLSHSQHTVFTAVSFSLFDGAIIIMLREHGGDYGLQRLFSNLGVIIMTPLSGIFIDHYSHSFGVQDYR